MQHGQKVTRFIAELKKLSSCPTKWYHKFSSEFNEHFTIYKRQLIYHPLVTTADTKKYMTNHLIKLNNCLFQLLVMVVLKAF